jgi:predicted nucleic acid-binding protein
MNPPSVLLDRTFLAAVADHADTNHDEAVATFRVLVDDFVEQRRLLVARTDHLTAVDNPDLFAPVDKLHVARQHLYAAANLRGEQLDPDLAITIVLIHRHRIRTVASFDERLAGYEITTLPAANSVAADTLGASAATYVGPASS